MVTINNECINNKNTRKIKDPVVYYVKCEDYDVEDESYESVRDVDAMSSDEECGGDMVKCSKGRAMEVCVSSDLIDVVPAEVAEEIIDLVEDVCYFVRDEVEYPSSTNSDGLVFGGIL